jgi:predicted GIY-YIG superfamily endonuclease
MDTFVYLLHFSRPISEHHTCQHYVGFTTNLPARIQSHRMGGGARLTQVAKERGISFEVVRVWLGNRDLERRIKQYHCSNRLCPHCVGNKSINAPELPASEIPNALIAF